MEERGGYLSRFRNYLIIGAMVAGMAYGASGMFKISREDRDFRTGALRGHLQELGRTLQDINQPVGELVNFLEETPGQMREDFRRDLEEVFKLSEKD